MGAWERCVCVLVWMRVRAFAWTERSPAGRTAQTQLTPPFLSESSPSGRSWPPSPASPASSSYCVRLRVRVCGAMCVRARYKHTHTVSRCACKRAAVCARSVCIGSAPRLATHEHHFRLLGDRPAHIETSQSSPCVRSRVCMSVPMCPRARRGIAAHLGVQFTGPFCVGSATCVGTFLHTYSCVTMCLCMYACVYACVCESVCVYARVSACMHACMCVHVSVGVVYLCMCVYVRVCMSTHVYTYSYIPRGGLRCTA